jgi:hypothetical protein
MSLIVETGTAAHDAEAYASVVYCDTYHSNMGNTLWASLTTVEKEQALRRAATFMCQSYRTRWKGYRVKETQALDWPRYDVQIPDLGVFNIVYPDTVPDLVMKANAILANHAISEDLNPALTQRVVKKAVGPLSVAYDSNSPQGKQYVAVTDMLRPFFESASGVNSKLRRM